MADDDQLKVENERFPVLSLSREIINEFNSE